VAHKEGFMAEQKVQTDPTARGAQTSELKVTIGAMAIAIIGALAPFLRDAISSMPSNSPYAMIGGAVCAIAAAVASKGYNDNRASVKSSMLGQSTGISEATLQAAQDAIPPHIVDALTAATAIIAAKQDRPFNLETEVDAYMSAWKNDKAYDLSHLTTVQQLAVSSETQRRIANKQVKAPTLEVLDFEDAPGGAE
jgi:hypothetical protein